MFLHQHRNARNILQKRIINMFLVRKCRYYSPSSLASLPSSSLCQSLRHDNKQQQQQQKCHGFHSTISTYQVDDNENNTEGPNCDIVQGPSLLRTPVYRPSPTLFILPGLRSLPFWTSLQETNHGIAINRIAYQDPIVTQVVQYLEDNIKVIQDEYVTNSKDLKSDYELTDHQDKGLHVGKWEWYSYLNKGNIQGHFAFHFPKTSKLLQQLRQDHILFEGTPFGFCFFSTLHENSYIKSHTSAMNLRLRIHLPLFVPSSSSSKTTPNNNDENNDKPNNCGIRVGPIIREWNEGKALVLDDSYEHEVWNNTSEKRVILLIDIWHPDVTIQERKEIVHMFQQAREQGLWKR